MQSAKGNSSKPGGRERLLVTARNLFMRRGASNVGINDVTDAAGVARMTLYNNFPSKEALTVAVYEELAQTALNDLRAIDRSERPERERVLALFGHLDDKAHSDGYRGCPLIHASLQEAEPEGSVYSLVHAYKCSLRQHIFGILDERRLNRADLADQILMLLDGAVTEAYLKGVAHPAGSAKRAAEVLLQAPQELSIGY